MALSGHGSGPSPAEHAPGGVGKSASNALRPPSEPIKITRKHPQSLKGARLRKHADFQRAYAAARKHQSASMSWFIALQSELPCGAGPRVGLTAGKVLGKAHERNRIKRRMREALRRHVELLPPGCDLILHPRRGVLEIDFAKLEAEIVRILMQANAEAARMKSNSQRPPAPAAAS
jgi:ribonuclease P protein component